MLCWCRRRRICLRVGGGWRWRQQWLHQGERQVSSLRPSITSTWRWWCIVALQRTNGCLIYQRQRISLSIQQHLRLFPIREMELLTTHRLWFRPKIPNHWSEWSALERMVSIGANAQHWSEWSALERMVSIGANGQHWSEWSACTICTRKVNLRKQPAR